METTINTTTTIRKERISKQVYFTLCDSCYWCASYLDGRVIESCCPACKISKVETIPVAGNEMYVFDYDQKRGVTVDFMPVRTSY
ncbi:MAG TPA: hypothetical protein VNI77_06750 [Nitrososphaera sp.]|nr:hypothetical protein [Nitrososphaera sp.]